MNTSFEELARLAIEDSINCKKSFHQCLIPLGKAIMKHITVSEIENDSAWKNLVKKTFTPLFKAKYSGNDRTRSSRQSEFAAKVLTLLNYCQVENIDMELLRSDDVKKILDDEKYNQGDFMERFYGEILFLLISIKT